MIFVTGDTHGLHDFHKLHIFACEHPDLTSDDYVIIAGDFGAIWSGSTLAENLSYYTNLPFTVLFVDGNHENFDLIETFPEEMWKGGRVHRIKPNIIHLMRGQVFEIEGKTFFTFGGATSIDRAFRIEGKSWWWQERATEQEFDEGIANLKRYNNEVDYVITHACGMRAIMSPRLRAAAGIKISCPEVQLLSNFENIIKCRHWYFGHFHMDERLNDKYTVLYNKVVEIK